MENELTHADILKRLDILEANLAPIIFTWKELTSLGRGFRIIGRGILWSAGLVVIVMAAKTALEL